MPKGVRCPSCGMVMHPKGWDVTYICTNFECKIYKKSGGHNHEMIKVFEDK